MAGASLWLTWSAMRLFRHGYFGRALPACFAILSLSCAKLGGAMPSNSPAVGRPTVTTTAGALEGRRDGAMRIFKGIPYASPPVGAARWRPPGTLPRWSGVKAAMEFGPDWTQHTSCDARIATSDI